MVDRLYNRSEDFLVLKIGSPSLWAGNALKFSRGKPTETQKLKQSDRMVFQSINQVVYEPIRESVKTQCEELLRPLWKLRETIIKRWFFIEELEFDEYFMAYLEFEHKFNCLPKNLQDQSAMVTTFKPPSPKKVMVLWTKFRSGSVSGVKTWYNPNAPGKFQISDLPFLWEIMLPVPFPVRV